MRKFFLSIVAVLFLVSMLNVPVFADWAPGDGHKMHYPQLPDEEGWDVNATFPLTVGDDWTCSGTGMVKDLHFWGSWMDDIVGNITMFQITFWTDVPVGPDDPYSLSLIHI